MTQLKTTTEVKPLDFFKPDARELARHDDAEATRLLGQDMLAKGQLQPVGATEDGRMIFGHGRLLGARAAGMKSLEAKIYPASINDTQFRLIRASENLHRKDLTGHQKWLLCAELMCGNPAWQQKDLAEALHLDPSMVTRLLSPSKCIPAAQEALAAGKIGISTCYTLSKCATSEEQAGMLAAALNGTSRDELEAAGRKSRKGTADSPKASRIKIELACGATVTIAGRDLSLDDAIQATADAQKRLRLGWDQGLTAKTISKVSSEVAKKE